MKRRPLYRLSTWSMLVIGLPMALLAFGVVLVGTTAIGDLPFDNPQLWWIGGAVPLAGVICLLGVARRAKALDRFVSADLSNLLASRVSPGRQATRACLTVLAILMLLAAILGPRWGEHFEKQKVHGVDIVVAVDVSRSMLATDVDPNRLARAKREIRQQLTERTVFNRSHRLGLLAFAGSTSLRVPLTTDHLTFRDKLADLAVGSVPRGGTAIARALQAASDLFVRSPQQASKVILLFTDGEDHEGGPVETAREIQKNLGIQVFTIGVGDPSRTVGAEVPGGGANGDKPLLHDGQIVFSKLDPSSLRQIAEAGGGRYAPIGDFHVLVDAVSSMSHSELTIEERRRYKPRYQWFLSAALFLLVLETLIPESRPGRDDLRRVWQGENSS